MANSVTTVSNVTEATAGVAFPGFAAAETPLVETGATPVFAVLAEIAVNQGPIAGMVHAGDRLLVTNHGGNSVSVIDTNTLSVVETITGTAEPFTLAAGNGRAYVSTVSAAYDSVCVLDTDVHAVVAAHPLSSSVRDLAATPDGTGVYASRTGPDGADVAVIDTTSDRVSTIRLGKPATDAGALDISPDGRRLYVATTDHVDGELVVIDTRANRVVDAIAIGAPIFDIGLSQDGDTAYVLTRAAPSGGAIVVVDTSTSEITETIMLGGTPTQLTISSDGGRAYVVDDDQVVVLCTATREVVDSITVGADPSSVTVGPDGTRVYVADYAGGVTVLSVASPPVSVVTQMMALDGIAAAEAQQRELATV